MELKLMRLLWINRVFWMDGIAGERMVLSPKRLLIIQIIVREDS